MSSRSQSVSAWATVSRMVLLVLLAVVVSVIASCGDSGSGSTGTAATAADTNAAGATTTPLDSRGIAGRLSTTCTDRLSTAEKASLARIRSLRKLDGKRASLDRGLTRQRRNLDALRAKADAAYGRAIANRSNTLVDRYNGLVGAVNASVRRFNAGVTKLNGAVAKMTPLIKKDDAAARTNAKRTDRCLLSIDDWIPATLLLEPALVAPAQTTGTVEPIVRCEKPVVRKPSKYDELGYVERGDTVLHLAPVTCLGLERVLAHPDSLDCAKTPNRRFQSCPPAVAEAVMSIVTLVHEQQHVDGIENEAVAQCNAYQKADQAAVELGVPADVAKRVALFTYRGISQPSKYHSKQCRSGGALDLKLSSGSWSYK